MARNEVPTRILIPRHAADGIAQSLSRRRFLGLAAGAAAGAAFLAACGGGDSGHSLKLFTWAEYDDPDVIDGWGKVTTDIYASNEEAIQKLTAAGSKSGYDVVVPTGAYIPQMSKAGLLEPLDLSKIPNFANVADEYKNQPWDQGNKYSVPKDWGSTGWIYDNTAVTTPIKTWQDFIDAAMGPASGKVSVLDAPQDILGVYFWANGIDWNTTNTAELDAAEDFLVNQLAPHIKAFDSYPGINLTQGNYALSQAWNGDARQGLISVEDAGGDPKQYTWGLGAPKTELWMDTWVIAKGANLDAAHDFINYILDVDNSAKELEFHGYNTGIKGIEEKMKDVSYPEIIFFDAEQVKNMEPGVVNEAQDRQVDIYNKVKAAAGA
jgi:spermidine/putrescine transport system substrate-binding protein